MTLIGLYTLHIYQGCSWVRSSRENYLLNNTERKQYSKLRKNKELPIKKKERNNKQKKKWTERVSE